MFRMEVELPLWRYWNLETTSGCFRRPPRASANPGIPPKMSENRRVLPKTEDGDGNDDGDGDGDGYGHGHGDDDDDNDGDGGGGGDSDGDGNGDGDGDAAADRAAPRGPKAADEGLRGPLEVSGGLLQKPPPWRPPPEAPTHGFSYKMFFDAGAAAASVASGFKCGLIRYGRVCELEHSGYSIPESMESRHPTSLPFRPVRHVLIQRTMLGICGFLILQRPRLIVPVPIPSKI